MTRPVRCAQAFARNHAGRRSTARAGMLCLALALSGCRDELPPAPAKPSHQTAGKAEAPHRIDDCIAVLQRDGEADDRWAALHELEAALDSAATALTARTDHQHDDPDLLAWQRGLLFLTDLASAGWPVDPLARVLDTRQLATARSTADAPTAIGPVSHFEAWLTAWLLRRRLQGREPALSSLPLTALADSDRPARLARPDSEPALWSLVLLAMLQREAGRTSTALGMLDLADAALVDASPASRGPTIAIYALLERASCQQLLGRPAAATRALAAAHALVAGWTPGDGADAERLYRETRAAVDLARIRQSCLTGHGSVAERQITALRASGPDPAILAQLDYYQSQVAHLRGDPEQAASLREQALAAPALAPRLRGMALLESASHALARRAAEGSAPPPARLAHARTLLARFDELAAERPQDDAPLLQARATALRARASRLEALTAARDSAARAAGLAGALAAAQAAYDSFLATWETADDGLGVGTLAFQPRRLLLDEVVELHLLTAPGSPGLERAFEAGLRVRARGALAESIQAPRTPTLAQVRDRLLDTDRTGLLVLLPGLETTHVFLLTRETLEHHRGAPLERLRPSIQALWRELAAVPDPAELAASRARAATAAEHLATALLDSSALRSRIAELSALRFVGADLLDRLPVETLPLGTDGQPLGLTHAVTVAPSTAVAVCLAERPSIHVPPRVVVLEAPSHAGMPDLAFPQASRALVERSGAHVDWLTADRASDQQLGRSGIDALLLFGHGILDASRPRPRGVALAPSRTLPDGRLFPDDLERLATRTATLVLLAVCETTGTDAQLGGDDSDHLAASFLRTGTRTVLASPCALEQTATAALAAATLARLADGVPIAEALREARIALRATPRFDHPRFWGTWSALGL